MNNASSNNVITIRTNYLFSHTVI